MIILDFATGRRLSAEESRLAYRRACEKKGRRGTESRKSLLAKVHIAKKQLALEDELYRALLRDAFSASSAAELSEKELQDLLMRFQSMGFQPAPGKRKRSAPKGLSGADSRARYLKKLEALLAEKGRAEGQAVRPRDLCGQGRRGGPAQGHRGAGLRRQKEGPLRGDAGSVMWKPG